MEVATIATIIATGIATVGLVYQIMRNFKEDVNKTFERYDKKFEIMEKRFEMIDQRLFLLCLGKDLPSIMKSEREKG